MRKQKPRKLRLAKETLRNLADREMKKVEGGYRTDVGCPFTGSDSCDSQRPCTAH